MNKSTNKLKPVKKKHKKNHRSETILGTAIFNQGKLSLNKFYIGTIKKKKSAQPKIQWRENKSVGNSTKRKYKTDLKTAMTNTERIFIQINSLQWSECRVGGQARDQAVNIDDLVAPKAAQSVSMKKKLSA